MKRIVILGATGSIGTQTLDVARRLPERLRIVGLSARHNEELLRRQAHEFDVPPAGLECGEEADLVRLARLDGADAVVVAVAGAVGIRATLAALEAGKDVALATKEVLVAAGELVMAAARTNGVRVLPIDSEHSAVFQCVQGSPADSVEKVWLTASGGPFREWGRDRMAAAMPADALNHPTWPAMGRKITIDSATLMNKGLETIEARWLFDLPMERIGIVIHPQSVIHSLVVFHDGSVLAQLGLPDMRLPIEYALLHPERVDAGLPRLDIARLGTPLTFDPPDEARFPCLALARRAAQSGGTMPAVLNAANEAAVGLFLEEKITFPAIPEWIERAMDAHAPQPRPTLTQILNADAWARRQVTQDF
ncbi:MAG: 1-deoxy-D-xylulose-5-phosphate reductoisomerase [Armatimonadetes bacterium]|nr:1-deoxy-D-xylulose-5-phosphate reductoisomerase [Armatimonadota bacterium]